MYVTVTVLILDTVDVEAAAVPGSGGEEPLNIEIPGEKETRPSSAGTNRLVSKSA